MNVNTLNELQRQIEALKAEIITKAAVVMKEGFAEFFAAFPQVKAVGWSQYVPYFNDGETCEFRSGEIEFLGEIPGDLQSYYDGSDVEPLSTERKRVGTGKFSEATRWSKSYELTEATDEYNDARMTKELDTAMGTIRNFLQSNEDFLENTYGSHALVLVTAEGVRFEEYTDHD